VLDELEAAIAVELGVDVEMLTVLVLV